jgi:oxalate decarboxylase/phosphoglucose isomerase-like protein (cupin superfamily)
MHWHPNGDEWTYWIKGKGRVTAFQTGPKAVTLDFNPGDIGYVKRNYGHYVKNIGDTELQYMEVFRSSYYADVSLSDWLTHTPPSLVAQHLQRSAFRRLKKSARHENSRHRGRSFQIRSTSSAWIRYETDLQRSTIINFA